jgi:RNA polymerase sigma-70 factor (ECF subfamily)
MRDRFHKLAQAYRDRVYTYALYSLRRREDAEDVTQDVLIKLWEHADALEEARVGAWVMRVTRNAVIDAHRRRRTRSEVLAETVDAEEVARTVAGGGATDGRAHAREAREAIEAALERLAEPYRSIIVMREIQEMSYGEIAESMEMPLNTIKVYLHRGRAMLRSALRERFETDAA